MKPLIVGKTYQNNKDMDHPVKYLLFDFGGVLVDLDKERCIRSFAALGFDVKPYLGTYAQGGIFSQLESGHIDEAVFCQKLREMSGNPILDDEQIKEAWRSYLTGVPAERLETLLRVGRHYRIMLLSNTNSIHWAQARDGYFRYRGHCVEDFFEYVFLSYELGVEKPAPEIYAKVLERSGARASEVLFLDDSETNCIAARACGLQAVVAPAGGVWLNYFDEEGRLCI